MKLRITNYKSQASSKNPGSESRTRPGSVRAFVSLGFWIWDLFGIWGLVPGAYAAFLCVFSLPSTARAGDQAQWGQAFTRNMVSAETGLVDRFDPGTGENVKWVVPLGSQTWSTPVVAQGRVFIGTNNDLPRDPRHKGDRGVLLCLDEKDGHLLWQLVVPKLGADPYLDWPRAGICSPVTVEGDRVYVLTNRDEVVCLDIAGQANGNDGPYRDEARYMTANGRTSLVAHDTTLVPRDANDNDGLIREVTALDADILWLFDIPRQAGTWPHDGAHGPALIDGDFLYVNTCNGLDSGHKRLRCPDGPSLICLDKRTGRLLARDDEGISARIFHSTWSPPALGVVKGQKRIFFCGGDGVVYGFEPLSAAASPGKPGVSSKKTESSDGDSAPGTSNLKPQTSDFQSVPALRCVWRFDPDPTSPKENVHQYFGNRRESPSNIKSTPVFDNNRLYVTVAGDIWWGKNQAWLKCIDAAGEGDVTAKGLVWSCDLKLHCCSTPAVQDGLVYVADCGRQIYCIDAATGKVQWTQETKGDIWASPLVADGKVYLGTNRGDFWILAAGRQKQVLCTLQLDSNISSTAIAANGVVYVATMKKLYALHK
jgi:outer membrane protein assembly factor BamB